MARKICKWLPARAQARFRENLKIFRGIFRGTFRGTFRGRTRGFFRAPPESLLSASCGQSGGQAGDHQGIGEDFQMTFRWLPHAPGVGGQPPRGRVSFRGGAWLVWCLVGCLLLFLWGPGCSLWPAFSPELM